jgi:AraC-like DNA-binding protein
MGDEVSVEQVRIRAESPQWSEPQVPAGYRLVFVRRGIFRARVGRHVLLADPAVAYAGGPAAEQSIAHRVGADDVCTTVILGEKLMAGLAFQGPTLAVSVPVTGDVAVAHRLLAARARQHADPFELAERAMWLASALLRRAPAEAGAAAGRPATAGRRQVTSGRQPATVAARRHLAESARELLAAQPSMSGLSDIARHIGCSPHHLSRVFHQETGMTLTRYRTRIRVLRALEAIDAGEKDLAGLAARLGFADHAHLTRSVRQESGCTPRELRELLAAPN